MILWKEFSTLKERASLLPIIFAPSGRMIGRQRGTRTSPFLAWGDFHARSRFAPFTIPEEKWETTSSLEK